MKLLIVDDQSTVVQGLLHCTNWAAMGFTVVDTALNACLLYTSPSPRDTR